ncbi:putative RNA uridine N3 methyltransferase [Aeropyrum camini]|uniref:putative RNA uridine N3 methyltransferase n=1 Tax=Aeropyrum camini TaxID=229980 RepID=UPI0007870578|nr:putative RNA uridine N3 methyltransferase [Aeropyrum camini]
MGGLGECFQWPPKRRPSPLAVAIPSSILRVEPTLLLKTLKAGYVGRVAAVYRVDEIVVYEDPDSSPRLSRLLKFLLSYQATPPHLKKRVVPLKRELKYASLMPPLKIPSHTVPAEPVEAL